MCEWPDLEGQVTDEDLGGLGKPKPTRLVDYPGPIKDQGSVQNSLKGQKAKQTILSMFVWPDPKAKPHKSRRRERRRRIRPSLTLGGQTKPFECVLWPDPEAKPQKSRRRERRRRMNDLGLTPGGQTRSFWDICDLTLGGQATGWSGRPEQAQTNQIKDAPWPKRGPRSEIEQDPN